jgi:HSP20 family protein
MNMRLYEPTGLLGRLSDEISRMMEPTGVSDLAGAGGVWSPAVDIREDANHYIIRADVPGVPPKDIEITLERGVLSITGHREEEKTTDENGYRRVERFTGQFARHFALPETVDEEKVDAKVKDGVLEITVNKKETVKPRRIAVKA